VILAALPGIVSKLLVNGELVKPGNFSATVNFLGSRIRKVGLAWIPKEGKLANKMAHTLKGVRVIGC
jgi:hypothetical protein